MQAGLVYGQIGQTEYIVKHMIAESGYEDIKVVATGGLGNLISKETDCINIYDPELTLQGLRLIYEKEMKNRRGRSLDRGKAWTSRHYKDFK